MNKNIIAAFVAGSLLAGGGAYLAFSNSKPGTVEITSKTTEQPLSSEPAAPVAAEPPAPVPVVVAKPEPKPGPVPATPAKPKRTVLAKVTSPAEEPMRIDMPSPVSRTVVNPAPEPVKVSEPVKPVVHGESRPEPVEIRKPDPVVEETRRKQREPARVTIPAGTQIVVRLQETLNAEKVQTGDPFHATLDAPLEVSGFVLAERGAHAVGRIVESDRAGRVRGVSKLALELTQITTSDGQTVSLQSETFNREGNTSRKSDAAKIGAGAAVGAALGAIFGGGKGAAIGGAAGTGAGGGTVLMTRGKPAVIEVETRIPFQTKSEVTVIERIK
ncbi:MAG: hypothetical protein K2X03_15830 [Bryobacteraceae bacterium]|nr:hypothetical protein [Bryobacteraceae bacterium]